MATIYKQRDHVPFLRKHPRTGAYYVRVPVPKALRDSGHPKYASARVVEEYLGTTHRPEAKRRAAGAVAGIRTKFDEAIAGKPLAPAEIDRIARRYARRIYDATVNDPQARKTLGLFADVMADEASGPGSYYAPRAKQKFPTHLAKDAEAEIIKTGRQPTRGTIDELRTAMASEVLEHLDAIKHRVEPPPIIGEPVRAAGASLGIRELGDLYLKERGTKRGEGLTAQTAAQARTTFRLFADHTGNAPLDGVTRREVATFLDALRGLHRHYGRRPGVGELSLQELLARFLAAEGAGLANKTLNRHLSALSKMAKWARQRGYVAENFASPFTDQKRAAADNPYLPFVIGELKAMFNGVTFDTKPKRHKLETYWPWLMAIGLFSGMREGEIADLAAGDVKRDRQTWFFDVTEAKSVAGVRRVPVHSRLIKLGLLNYVKHIGSGPLFPELPEGPRGGGRGHVIAKRFPAFRRGRKVDRDGVAFHSFRKSFVRALELAKVDRDRAALVVGHERGFTYRVYNPDKLPPHELRDVVEAVKFPGLKL